LLYSFLLNVPSRGIATSVAISGMKVEAIPVLSAAVSNSTSVRGRSNHEVVVVVVTVDDKTHPFVTGASRIRLQHLQQNWQSVRGRIGDDVVEDGGADSATLEPDKRAMLPTNMWSSLLQNARNPTSTPSTER
jgi:ribosomal protein L31